MAEPWPVGIVWFNERRKASPEFPPRCTAIPASRKPCTSRLSDRLQFAADLRGRSLLLREGGRHVRARASQSARSS